MNQLAKFGFGRRCFFDLRSTFVTAATTSLFYNGRFESLVPPGSRCFPLNGFGSSVATFPATLLLTLELTRRSNERTRAARPPLPEEAALNAEAKLR